MRKASAFIPVGRRVDVAKSGMLQPTCVCHPLAPLFIREKEKTKALNGFGLLPSLFGLRGWLMRHQMFLSAVIPKGILRHCAPNSNSCIWTLSTPNLLLKLYNLIKFYRIKKQCQAPL
jgi:hypothetical protein